MIAALFYRSPWHRTKLPTRQAALDLLPHIAAPAGSAPPPFCLHKERNDHHRQVHQDGLVYPCHARRHRKRQFNISQQLPPRAPKSRSRLFGSFGNTAHAECRKTNDRWHCKSDCCQYTRLLSCAKKRNKRNKVNKSGMVCMKSRMGSAKR